MSADLSGDDRKQPRYPYLSPAAVARWLPVAAELVRACLDEKIETGQIDFVDDLANIVPAVLTLAMMGIPLSHWTVYCEPAHASVYIPPNSPAMARVRDAQIAMFEDMYAQLFDTTTALTANALEWLSGHPAERDRRCSRTRTRSTWPAPATGTAASSWVSTGHVPARPAARPGPSRDQSRPCSGPVPSSGWPNRSPCARPRRISAYDAVGSGLG